MKRNSAIIWMVLVVLFIGTAMLVNLMPDRETLPYSSSSTGWNGTKAAYRLLSELGFRVERKTQKNYNGDGVVIALGPEYLSNAGDALMFENDDKFINSRIEDNAEEFVALMWPYRDRTIVFEEYGRMSSSSLAKDLETGEVTLWSVMPVWLKVLFLDLLCAAFFIMFFYGQRLGKPLVPEEFSGRQPLESVHAMVGALEKTRAYKECVAFYYRYCVRNGSQWDWQGRLGQSLDAIHTEREALMVVAEIDRQIKEYHNNEGKGTI